jgi:hypothetical protein
VVDVVLVGAAANGPPEVVVVVVALADLDRVLTAVVGVVATPGPGVVPADVGVVAGVEVVVVVVAGADDP